MDMVSIFVRVLNMSLMAGYCIVAVIVLRFLLRRQPKILSYLLWSVVLFRLLCPFSVTSSYSLLRMNTAVVSQESFAGGEKTAGTVWQGKGYFDWRETEAGEAGAVPSADTGEQKQTDWRQQAFLAGAWIWLAGIAVLLCYSLWTSFRFRRFISGAFLTEEGFYETEGISTPFVFGVIRPNIYLPTHLQPEQRRYVLEHERVHIARKDYLVKLLGWGAVCLHWFNPFVWLAFVLMERDMEMSCDEVVLRRLGGETKKAYSFALLQLSSEGGRVGGSPIAFGEGSVKGRIQNILGWHKRRIVTVVSLAILLGVLVLGLALDPAGRTQKEAEELLRLGAVEAYAKAFCDQDGETLVSLYIDEETALDHVMFLEKAGGSYILGLSSPWPDEFRFVLDEEEGGDEGKAEIWYYAWTSDPHISVWKEEIRFAEGNRVTDSSLQYLDSISSLPEFEEAYLIGGEYLFTDYAERGFVDAINEQAVYDRENGGADRNAVYRSPDTAAAWILNLEGGQCVMLSYVSGEQATVVYTFADGSSVEIPMYNANYDQRTTASGTADAETGTTSEVWLPDLRVWNAKAPL